MSVPYTDYLTAGDIGSDNTSAITCEQVRTSIDLLSGRILDCDARRKILQCGRAESNSYVSFPSQYRSIAIVTVIYCYVGKSMMKEAILHMGDRPMSSPF